MFLEPRRNGEDIGVEDDVLCREADAGQQLVGALAYLDLAFFRVGLPNLVERHHDHRRAVSPALARLVEERLLAFLPADRIDNQIGRAAWRENGGQDG